MDVRSWTRAESSDMQQVVEQFKEKDNKQFYAQISYNYFKQNTSIFFQQVWDL